jgi:prolyl oligopeptidase
MNDKEIFSRAVNKDLGLEKIDVPMLFTFLSSDKVIINTMKGTGQYYSVYYAGLDDVLYKPAETVQWEKICDNNEKMGSNVLYGNRFFGISYKSNPNGQLIMMTLPDLAPKVLFEGNGFSLDDMVINNNSLYITSLENGLNKLVQVDLKNYHSLYIELPFQGGIHLRPSFPVVSFYQPGDNVIFGLTAFNKQWDMYICGTDKQVRRTNLSPETEFIRPPLDLIIEEVQVPSYDGAMVPLSIVYKKGIKSDGANPTLIDAYGAYGYTYKSEFDRNRLAWFDHGGIFAVAHVRGGGEKGDNWYKGGFKATKPNSWKDLIACAEYLVKNNYTSPQKLAVTGTSAGGITAGRAITERPELFKAAVIFVGDLNAIRMENTFNNTSVTEFGTVKDSLEFQYLYDMDTYHHIREGVSYPSVLFTAGLNDSRVAPWEPAKAVARMQQVSKGDKIILFRIEDRGHFDYPSDADVYSFLFWQLGVPGVKFRPEKCVYKTIDK